MQTFTIAAAIAFLATSVYGAPAAEARQFEAQITFNGADPAAYFTQSVPTDGSTFHICTFSRVLFIIPSCQLIRLDWGGY